MSKKKILKGGIATNLDIKISPAQREERNTVERAGQHVEDKIKSEGTIGSDKTPQLINKYTELQVTFDQLADSESSESRPIIPIAAERNSRGGVDWILTEPDYWKVKSGKNCAKCLQPQSEIMTPTCHWKNARLEGLTGCGHVRNLEFDMSYEKV